MTTNRERIGDFRELLGKLAQVPKAELDRETAKYEANKHEKKAAKRKKRS